MLTVFGKRLPRHGAALLAKRSTNFPVTNRNFASSADHDDLHETQKWEKITYVGIATCLVLAVYNLSKGPHHSEEPPVMYPYMRIRNKDYPWGPESLFEKFKKHD